MSEGTREQGNKAMQRRREQLLSIGDRFAAWWRERVGAGRRARQMREWRPELYVAALADLDRLTAQAQRQAIEIAMLKEDRELAAGAAQGWMKRCEELRAQLRAFSVLGPSEAQRMAVLAEHAGRAAMLAGRVLRYGWEATREGDGVTLRELLSRETESLMSISRQVLKICAAKEEGGDAAA